MAARWVLPLCAILIRTVIALVSRHVEFDVKVMFAMNRALHEHGFKAYGHVPEWVYPPGLMAWVVGGIWIADRVGLERKFVLRLPSILADAALTYLVVATLEKRGAARRLVWGAGSLVAFGPMFVAVSSYQGQIDALAILPAAVAVLWWTRTGIPLRALVCGSLVGIGAALKTVPGFMVLALLPTARSFREGAVLVVTAAAIPLLALLPFLIADPGGAGRVFQYAGIPGLGGWSVFVQPSLTRSWLLAEPLEIAPLTTIVYLCGAVATLVALALITLRLVQLRTPPVDAACAIWLTVFALAVGFFPQYTIWGLPFLLMAGLVSESALVTAPLVPITVLIVLRPLASPAPVPIYQAAAMAMQLAFVFLWARTMKRMSGIAPI